MIPDEVAVKFSYLGTSTKASFSDLEVNNVIFGKYKIFVFPYMNIRHCVCKLWLYMFLTLQIR